MGPAGSIFLLDLADYYSQKMFVFRIFPQIATFLVVASQIRRWSLIYYHSYLTFAAVAWQKIHLQLSDFAALIKPVKIVATKSKRSYLTQEQNIN